MASGRMLILEQREENLRRQLQEVAEAQAVEAERERMRLALQSVLPDQDLWNDGVVLYFRKVFANQPDKEFDYVALKKVGLWWTTGTVNVHSGMGYDRFRSFVIFEALSVVVEEASLWVPVEFSR